MPYAPDAARFVVLPVPFDATTSYRDGTRHGPAAVLEASRQVDLFDLDFGKPYERGIAMIAPSDPGPRRIAALNRAARRLAVPIIRAGGHLEGRRALKRNLSGVNARCAEMNDLVERTVRELLAKGKVPIVLGGDHSTPFGAIKAYAEKYPGLGILHIDAHADLRESYEGFEWSHASIMYNVVRRLGGRGVANLVQVGLRDVGEREVRMIEESAAEGPVRISAFFDVRTRARLHAGESWSKICDEIVACLPDPVYLSVDIDGFDPILCPSTGTPVPGGLSMNEFFELLRALGRAGRRVVGGDLNEVAPDPREPRSRWEGDWNANVGARVLYKIIGACAVSTEP